MLFAIRFTGLEGVLYVGDDCTVFGNDSRVFEKGFIKIQLINPPMIEAINI